MTTYDVQIQYGEFFSSIVGNQRLLIDRGFPKMVTGDANEWRILGIMVKNSQILWITTAHKIEIIGE